MATEWIPEGFVEGAVDGNASVAGYASPQETNDIDIRILMASPAPLMTNFLEKGMVSPRRIVLMDPA